MTLLITFVVGIFKFAPTEHLFQDHLSDARALIAINDIEGAIKSYKLAVMENLDDPLVRREYIDFLKEHGDQEEWLELEQTFLRAFPSLENFKSYDNAIYQLVLQVNNESQRILNEGDITEYQSKRREQQELLKLFSPALFNLEAPSEYSLDYVPGPIFGQIFIGDANDTSDERIIKAHLLIELNIAWALLIRGDSSYFNFLTKDGNVQSMVRDDYVFTSWAERYLKVHLLEVALDASNTLTEQDKVSVAQELLEICTATSLEYMRDAYQLSHVYFTESVFNGLKEKELIPDLFRECSYRLTVLHMNKGEFDVADSTMAALKKNYGDICETCDSLEDESKFSWTGLSNRFRSFVQNWDGTNASEAFNEKNWQLASEKYLQEADFYGRYRPDIPDLAAEAFYNAAMAYWNNEYFSKAKKYLSMIKEKYPSYLPEKIAEKLVSINKSRINFLVSKTFKKGTNAFDQGKYGEAIKHFQKALDSSPNHIDSAAALFNIGQSYFLLEQYTQAITFYERLLKDYSSYNPEKVRNRIADANYNIGFKNYVATNREASQAFEGKSWTTAVTKYLEAERLARRLGNEALAAESAYNGAISLRNQKKNWSGAIAVLRAIQKHYPTYEPNLVREQIKDMQSSCPNQYLGC